MKPLRVVLIKPSKYDIDGFVQRYRKGFMPNATLPYIAAMTPKHHAGVDITVDCVDEYVHADASYLPLLERRSGENVLVCLVGTQSHQFHRAADLAAYAVEKGSMAIIGGPHAITCETPELQRRGVSVCMAEAELVWLQILEDASRGELAPVYGADRRWAETLDPPVLQPLSKYERRRYLGDMQGIYPARGCPKVCNFCSVREIFGRNVRSQPIETTIQSLLAAQAGGVQLIMFTSDNFNQYEEREALLEGMIEAGITIPFMCQCTTDIAEQPELVALMGRANCFQIFLGAESFNRRVLQEVHKGHNRPAMYGQIVSLLAEHGIGAHFSNIIGFEPDTEESIKDSLEQLKKIQPARASFYLLMHIPGTERYGELLHRDPQVITEPNLDRFDAACPTWRHPHMSPRQLLDMIRDRHREFYSIPQVRRTVAFMRKSHPNLAGQAGKVILYAAFARLMAWKGQNPMSGGIGRVRADHVSEYLPRRRKFYGLGDYFPLPKNLKLSEAEEAINRRANANSWKTASPVLALT